MRIEKAMLVFKKDWREIRRNWQVILPIVVVPLMISVFLPVILTVIPSLSASQGGSLNGGLSGTRREKQLAAGSFSASKRL